VVGSLVLKGKWRHQKRFHLPSKGRRDAEECWGGKGKTYLSLELTCYVKKLKKVPRCQKKREAGGTGGPGGGRENSRRVTPTGGLPMLGVKGKKRNYQEAHPRG